MTEPPMIPKPMGRLLMPTWIGSLSYMLSLCTGHQTSTEKKFAPDAKVISRIRIKFRGFCFRRPGNMGHFANFHS